MKKNELNFSIPASLVKEAMDDLELVYDKLKPYLLTDISRSQLDGYNRMGESGQMFVNSIYDCVQQEENLIPRSYSMEEAMADKTFYSNMKEISIRIEHISSILAMNCDLAGIEMLDFATEVYFSIKRRSQEGDPVAMEMFDRVKSRYQKPRRKGKEIAP
jgi:hypothetical protein